MELVHYNLFRTKKTETVTETILKSLKTKPKLYLLIISHYLFLLIISIFLIFIVLTDFIERSFSDLLSNFMSTEENYWGKK